MDICKFDYFIFDKVSRIPVLAQYNMLIANDLVKDGSQPVFQNDAIVVLKNTKVGDDCIEKRSF